MKDWGLGRDDQHKAATGGRGPGRDPHVSITPHTGKGEQK